MTTILCVRHAESVWNAESRLQGRGDPPLSVTGREQAVRAAERLSGFQGAVVASPLRRAVQTAEILANGPVLVEEGLQEWDAGDWTGLTPAQIEERYPDDYRTWRAGKLVRYPGGSDRATYHELVIAALHRIAEAHDSDEIVAVSHAGAIASVERHLGVFPGGSVPQLSGRWFDVSSDIRAIGDRVNLLDD
jgi:probable phosphoglycerate mutase